ncbi:MAG: DedA family protein [Verrucomicrobia bacterium]|nr:DedA family protein [Verrucomicrobiota bacterium]MBU4292201.1 DedA family protein [Verrucomicrobiota bacterium]MBU4496412.1 DedA family protein [Verrucomicrobiota bacterium]MCG2678715.1 DedA family protein [Kiritimatiellia bacterium]
MEMLKQLIDLFLHLDKHLAEIVASCGLWTYGVLFAIIFCETGLIVMPFLPGDSLLFAAGALTAHTSLQVGWLLILLILAAVIGDAVNYAVGYYLGEAIIRHKSRLIKPEHLARTHEFFEKYGKMTIVLARFAPIVRTFAPFVAGMAKMRYTEFALYNVTGAILWVCLFVIAGRLFGNLPVVKEYFSLVIGVIIVLSVLPIAYEVWRQRRNARRSSRSRCLQDADGHDA